MRYRTMAALMRPFQERQASRARRGMRDFLSDYGAAVAGKDAASIRPVSGTFIYSRPPDYRGAPSESWGRGEWLREFGRLKSLGIDTVLYQGAVGETTNGDWAIYYEPYPDTLGRLSSIEARLGRKPAVEPGLGPILDAAAEAGLGLYLGLYNVLEGWFSLPPASFVDLVLSEELEVAADLVARYANHPALAGWYVSPEIMYQLHGSRRGLDMGAFLRRLTAPLRAATPAARIGISPGSFWREGRMGAVEAFWAKTLAGSGVDVLLPQDSVGVLSVPPSRAADLWKSWARVASASGVELWANCESFERATYYGEEPFVSAGFPRFLAQLEAASPSVSKIVTWEAMHFMNPQGAPRAGALEAEYRAFFGL